MVRAKFILTSKFRMQFDISIIPAITPLLCCFHDLSHMLQSHLRHSIFVSRYIQALHGSPTTLFSLTPRNALNPEFSHTNSPQMIHSAITTPIMIPASLKIATLFPAAAIRPNRPAEPFRDVLIDEKVSDYDPVSQTIPLAIPTLLQPQAVVCKHTVLSITSCALALS